MQGVVLSVSKGLLTLRRGRETSDFKTLALYITRGLHARSDRIGRFTNSITAQFFVIHPRDFDVNVNSIEQGTGDSLLIFRRKGMRTGAGLLGIAIKSARAGVYAIELFSIFNSE